jgi:hypothetical protein
MSNCWAITSGEAVWEKRPHMLFVHQRLGRPWGGVKRVYAMRGKPPTDKEVFCGLTAPIRVY